MKRYSTPGFFDEENRLEQLNEKKYPLLKLSDYIDLEFFRKPLEDFFTKDKDAAKGGRPNYDYVMMFKILILQRYYNLSDDETEFAIMDRLSFMQFLGLTLADKVPDAKTIWHFRDQLAQGGMVEKLFKRLDRQLDKDGIVAHTGKMIDASFVEVPRQRNSREENAQVKKGEVPEQWENKPNKLSQKDLDARWTKKNNIAHYGYKNHIKGDIKTKLITGYSVTSAEVHDINLVLDLLDNKEDVHQTLYADSAYRSDELQAALKARKISSRIHEKGRRSHPLTDKQKQSNRKRSTKRVRVEHIFGFMENSMHGMYIRCIGKVRTAANVGLMNLTYNLFRLPQINMELRS